MKISTYIAIAFIIWTAMSPIAWLVWHLSHDINATMSIVISFIIAGVGVIIFGVLHSEGD